MSKIETLRQSARQANEQHLERLALQIESLRQAKAGSAEELARQIEPLAQAMAALTDETRETLTQIQDEAKAAQRETIQQWQEALMDWHRMVVRLQSAAEDGQRAARGLSWRQWLYSGLTAAVTAALLSGFWIWQERQLIEGDQQRLKWLESTVGGLNRYLVRELYPNLNPQRQSEIEALYRQLGLIAPQEQSSGN